MFALILAVDGDNLLDPFVIGGNGKSHCVIFLVGSQGAGRNHNNLIGDRSLGNVELAAPDNDSIAFLLHDAYVHVGVRLLDGPLHALTLHIGLGAASHEIFFLESF